MVAVAVLVLAVHVQATAADGDENDSSTSDFTVVNGQVFTPGLAIVDAPQLFTPLGGGELYCTHITYAY